MSNQNFKSFNNLINHEPSIQPRTYPLVSPTAFLPFSSFQPNFTQSFPIMSNDIGICDELNGCHLTETWTGSGKQESILSSSVTGPYAPFRRPSDFFTGEQNKDNCNVKFKKIELKAHRQQQPILDGLLRLSVLNNESKSSFDSINKTPVDSIANMNQLNINGFRVKKKIKHHELIGSIHRDDIRSSNEATSISMTSPPKKKWIRHYMTGKVKFFISHRLLYRFYFDSTHIILHSLLICLKHVA